MKPTKLVFAAIIAAMLFTGAPAFAQAPPTPPAPATIEDEVAALSEAVIKLQKAVREVRGTVYNKGTGLRDRVEAQGKELGRVAAQSNDAWSASQAVKEWVAKQSVSASVATAPAPSAPVVAQEPPTASPVLTAAQEDAAVLDQVAAALVRHAQRIRARDKK